MQKTSILTEAVPADYSGDIEAGEKVKNAHARKLAMWLFACCFMVILMVFIGGLTRLTDSGLSMVHWKPATGFIPPLSDEAWQQEFAHYQESPEYKKVNFWMDVHDFKRIFWFEFGHRVLGRITGLVFFIPFLFFIYKKMIPKKLTIPLFGIFCLGGLQGVIGWYMVQSGLVDDPQVSQYRLVVHLSMAFLLYSAMFLLGVSLWSNGKGYKGLSIKNNATRRFSLCITLCIFLQIIAGGFVAGLDAGKAYNTFPLMDGDWVPGDMYNMKPVMRNWFENITTVQFNHRLLAVFVTILIVAYWLFVRIMSKKSDTYLDSKVRSDQFYAHIMLAVVLIQMMLGIATLLFVVPVVLASLHQMGALALLSVSLFINYQHCARKGNMIYGNGAGK